MQVDKPDAVGPAEQDALLLAELLETSLHLAAAIAHFRKPARKRPGRTNPRAAACSSTGMIIWLPNSTATQSMPSSAGMASKEWIARQSLQFRVIRVDGVDPAVKSQRTQVFDGNRSGPEAFRGADDGNGAGRKEATQILFQDEAS